MKRVMTVAMAIVAGFALTASAGKKEEPKGDRFSKADADGDGRLSLTEFGAIFSKHNAEKKFKALDADGDGFLSREEFKGGSDKKAEKKKEELPPK